jgi:D-sedoheptulose 7-phosphate isomerase/D-glycero-D-manno-heptose 1,7-bisphosphate phosphatase
LTGFSPDNKCAQLADISLHVDIQEYEAAEDVHQAIMHMIAKYIRNRGKVT